MESQDGQHTQQEDDFWQCSVRTGVETIQVLFEKTNMMDSDLLPSLGKAQAGATHATSTPAKTKKRKHNIIRNTNNRNESNAVRSQSCPGLKRGRFAGEDLQLFVFGTPRHRAHRGRPPIVSLCPVYLSVEFCGDLFQDAITSHWAALFGENAKPGPSRRSQDPCAQKNPLRLARAEAGFL